MTLQAPVAPAQNFLDSPIPILDAREGLSALAHPDEEKESANVKMFLKEGLLQRLNKNDIPRITAHLKRMNPEDRQLRFCGTYSDEQIDRYAQSLVFEVDVVLGAFRYGVLIGVCQLAKYLEGDIPVGEIGVSVDSDQRGLRFGARLVEAALAEGSKASLSHVYIHFLLRNRRMARMCSRHEASITRGGDFECTAKIQTTPPK